MANKTYLLTLPVLANLFMGHYEKIWLENYTGNSPSFYRRYIDDIFAVFNNENEVSSFFDYLNKPTWKFSVMENYLF